MRKIKTGYKCLFAGSTVFVAICSVLLCSSMMAPAEATATDLDELRFGNRIDPITEKEEYEAYDRAEKARMERQKQQYRDEVKTNESGLTYGSAFGGDPFTGEDVPDLVSVRATNGQHGYMYFTDWHAVHVMDATRTPEDLEKTSARKDQAVADEFSRLMEDVYGCKLLSDAEALFVCSKLMNGEDYQIMHRFVADVVAERVMSNTDAAGNKIVETTDNADSAALSAIQVLAEKAGIDVPADANSLLELNQFVELYQTAYDSYGVAVPVYLNDGKTQIGVYLVDVL